MKRITRTLLATTLIGSLAASTGCAPADSIDEPEFNESTDDKADGTDYLGNRAAEVGASVTATIFVAMNDRTQTDLESLAAGLRGGAQPSWEIIDAVGEQLKYARNTLKAQKFDMNLEGGTPTIVDARVVDGGLELDYKLSIESLVKFAQLAEGTKVSDLLGKKIDVTLPRNPAGLYARATIACAIDPDGDALDPHEIRDDNYFFYWGPTAEGCGLGANDLVTAHYEATSSLDSKTVYPEYDQLVADGQISMVAIFGQIEHGDLAADDWGFISYDAFIGKMKSKYGFKQKKKFADGMGLQLAKTYANGLKVTIDIYTPKGFADHVPREESNARFVEAIKTHEIVYYAGHAFYGSLDVLKNKDAYPENQYQVIFMDACWSYAYYTKQVFENKVTEADPKGFALADVVNNTEPGNTGSEETAAVLWGNLFKGADLVKGGKNPKAYSWGKLIGFMNEHAEWRAESATAQGEPQHPEIYGVSGVRSNTYKYVKP